jgi:hypothetical protein
MSIPLDLIGIQSNAVVNLIPTYYDVGTKYIIPIDAAFEHLEVNLNKLQVEKNEWLEENPACAFLDIISIDSACYYYDIFDELDNPADYLDINNKLKQVPGGTNFCD